ncbi:MAG: NAD(P)H-dependent oxidoreductase subunit E [Chloroflexi bacterium]|mgnify:FL=1|jgi:NADH-quinone oxidoreductase subunit E|nr:NAD(P)H-dependent oxidoreductase subunit E [Chloroflexota bacterium]
MANQLREQYGEIVDGLLRRYPQKKSAILPLMHLAQRVHGYMSQEAMNEVAEILDIDSTHVLSLAGFYTLYYEEPVGKYVLEVCTDLACALRGADEFLEMVLQKLQVGVDEMTEDGLFTVKPVMCLAACDKAPMLQCNLRYYENLNEEKFDALIAQLRAEAEADAADREPTVIERTLSYAAGDPPATK